MALTPQEIATGVLNSDRTVADVQAFRGSYLPYGAYESLLQQARRNEERMAKNVTSSQIEASYGQQSRPDVSGLANREAPSYAAPKRQNVRPNKTGVIRLKPNSGKGSVDVPNEQVVTSGSGSAGVPNEQVRTMTTPDGKGIITDGNLNEEMAKTARQRVGENAPKNVPNEPDADEASSVIIPALVGLGTAAGGVGVAAKAYNKLKSKADEKIKANEKLYNQVQKEAGLMSDEEYKADTVKKAADIRDKMIESLKSNKVLMRDYANYAALADLAGETPLTWEAYLEKEQLIPTKQEVASLGNNPDLKASKNATYDAAGAEPTAKAASPSAATKYLNRALGLATLGLSGKGEYEALKSVINKVFDGKNWEDYNAMNAAEEVADGVLNPIIGMAGADDTARKTMALVRGLFDANNAEDYANFERWERERQERKARMANKSFLDYINPLNAIDTAGDLLVPAQDAVDYIVNGRDWGSNEAMKKFSESMKKR